MLDGIFPKSVGFISHVHLGKSLQNLFGKEKIWGNSDLKSHLTQLPCKVSNSKSTSSTITTQIRHTSFDFFICIFLDIFGGRSCWTACCSLTMMEQTEQWECPSEFFTFSLQLPPLSPQKILSCPFMPWLAKNRPNWSLSRWMRREFRLWTVNNPTALGGYSFDAVDFKIETQGSVWVSGYLTWYKCWLYRRVLPMTPI